MSLSDLVTLRHGDCLDVLSDHESESVDLIYLDPPFFTNQTHRLSPRDRSREFSFEDLWSNQREYSEFIFQRIVHLHRVLKPTGSLFFHCDRNATHLVRTILEQVFGPEMFRSEIVWHYRRWSNSKKGLLPSHQTIFYFTKTDSFTFNEIRVEYSPSTNVDQILQRRSRDESNKSVYDRDQNGKVVINGEKKGVPLGDVWDIPYLNPKAKERVGYPTQKPLALLERIVNIASCEGELVLDPFCGSGTTVVAAALLGRNAIGIDKSIEAIDLAKERVSNPVRTDSRLSKVGRDAYRNVDPVASSLLGDLETIPVQRNSGIDAFLKGTFENGPIPIRVQRENETIVDAANKLVRASSSKGAKAMFLVVRYRNSDVFDFASVLPEEVTVVESSAIQIRERLAEMGFISSAGQE